MLVSSSRSKAGAKSTGPILFKFMITNLVLQTKIDSKTVILTDLNRLFTKLCRSGQRSFKIYIENQRVLALK